jgi:hypothetical protein
VSLLVGLLFSGLAAAAVSQVPPTSTPGAGPGPAAAPYALKTLNDGSRAVYRHAREAALARSGPVILLSGDDLILRKDGQRVEVHFMPAVYHVLKSVSHVTMALDVCLAAHADEEPLGAAVLAELKEYRAAIATGLEEIGSAGLDPEQVERQRKLLTASLQCVDSVVAARRCTRQERVTAIRRMMPWVMSNAAEAARAALDALHRQVSLWRSQMSPEEWKRLSVVIMGRQLPRRGNLAVQYFARLLGERGEGRRITYAESITEESKALDLMATRTVDTGLGADFFNDPMRMHRDLLENAAREYLPILIDRP